MRFGRFVLEGYIGIYNGMELTKIEIDFRKCKNKVIIIRGLNGSGKSTLFNALTPLPDNNSCFLSTMNARKEIEIIDGDIVYLCRLVHGLKNNGERDTSKGYIKKIHNGEEVELNPNGNITSYKELIYEHLHLDASFEQLTQIAATNRGLADKKPAERKLHISNILPDMEVYNNIYKTLSKRATIFRSYINSLTSKLNFLGTEESITSLLTSLENRLNRYMSDKDKLTEEIAMHKSTIGLLDPDNTIRSNCNAIYSSISSIDMELESIDKQSLSIDELAKKYNEIDKELSLTENNIIKLSERVQSLMKENDTLAKEFNTKQAKIISLGDTNNIFMVEKAIKELKRDIMEAEEIFKEMGFEDGVSLSKQEYLIGMDLLKSLKEMIGVVKAASNYSILEKALEWYNFAYMPDINKRLKDKEKLQMDLYAIDSEIVRYNTLLELSKKLENRPSKCKIDDCFFITDALKAANQNPLENILTAETVKKDIEQNIIKIDKWIKEDTDTLETYNRMIPVFRALWSNRTIIGRLPNGENFTAENIVARIINNDNFDDINDLLKYIQYCDLFDTYSMMKNNLYKLEADYTISKSTLDSFNEAKNELASIQSSMSKANLELESMRASLYEANIKVIELTNSKNTYLSLISLQEKRSSLEKSRAELMARIFSYEEQYKRISIAQDGLHSAITRLESINKDIKPLLEERDTIKHSLKNIQQYKIELNEFLAKYDKVQTLRDEASPTKGIQTLFVELYMGTIINMANELIQNFFNGKFKLLPFVVNEDEFRIPCKGSGMPNDDISSLSGGEAAMISMILSFAIMIHSSSSYNILRLDEIDGALDSENRASFMYTLDEVQNKMRTEMCIMISHNTEMSEGNCDLILLKLPENTVYNGNIIYNYSEVVA